MVEGSNRVARSPSSTACSGDGPAAQRDQGGAAGGARRSARRRAWSPCRRCRRRRSALAPPAMASICGGQPRHRGRCSRRRIAARIGGVEAVDVGQQHQQVGADHLRHAGGQPVVVAVADLLGGHGVVLVDHRRRRPAPAGSRGWRARSASGGGPRCRRGSAGPGRRRCRAGSSASSQARISSDWPAAAAACFSGRVSARLRSGASRRRPSATAPEETISTCWPRARSRADVGGEGGQPGAVGGAVRRRPAGPSRP